MIYKWVGAVLILAGSSSFGFSILFRQKREEHMISQLESILEDMLLELPFRLTPLPDLIRHAANRSGGAVANVLNSFSEQLDRQVLPDASSCMSAALSDENLNDPRTKHMLSLMGDSLGRFDLSGQLNGLQSVKERCSLELLELRTDRENRLKSYRILSICAGIALVILLI